MTPRPDSAPKPGKQPTDKQPKTPAHAGSDVSDPHPGSVSDGTHPEADESKSGD
ncbi:hypothetical protein [Hoeflea sp. BAL378]|uniref:hypothetical protein n=1 Tax=Hoeflea sp. BAL378 TaxID=1547437 RepID=UPI000A63F165|nr:hypothetical protein [Hoeflea sp. BAL378]